MLQKMMYETNPEYTIEQITYPGMSLEGHLNNMIESQSGDNMSVRQKQPEEITEPRKRSGKKTWISLYFKRVACLF